MTSKSRHDIQISKYHLFKLEISYLGRVISSAGYTADPINIAVSSKLKKKPSSITELRNILGSVGCFRRSIANFNQTASPLYQTLTDIEKNQLTGMIMINLSSLFQMQNGKLRVLGFVIRTLVGTEKRIPQLQVEILSPEVGSV